MSRFPLLVALAAGAASVFAFAPFGAWPVAFVTVAMLFRLWSHAPTPGAAARVGFAFGTGYVLAGVSWVYVSLHDFGMMPMPLAAVATLGFCLYLALWPALAGYLQARLPGGPAWKLVATMPALWTLAEWTRGWLLTGFPWLALGNSQTDTPLVGFAPVAGVYGMTLATTLVAGAIAAFAGASGRARAAMVALVAAVFIAGGVLRTIAWTTPAGPGLEVALVQGNIAQDLKFDPGQYDRILATYGKLVTSTRAKLTVLPETAIPRFFDAIDPDFLDTLANHAKAADGDILLGAPTGDLRTQYYNAVVSIGRSPVQTYAKSHLVPFGEFVPPAFGWVVNVLQVPLSSFSRGPTDQKPLALAGERVAVNICYEDAFGAEIIRQLPEATVLVNVSNVAWFGRSLAPDQHLQISRLRAYETGRAMLRATNTGMTAIIDPYEREVKVLEPFTEAVLVGRVQGYTGATPYVRAGDAPALVLAALLALLGALGSGRFRRG